MKRLYPLLFISVLIYWGCEDKDTTPTEVTLWGVVYSVGSIMIINFLFKLDETKNNLEGEKTNYYRSGQKQLEGTYKDGEFISLKRWNEDGSVRE